MVQAVGGLSRVAAAVPDGTAPAVGPLPGFHHKAALHAGEGQAVVVACLHKACKVIIGLRGLVREKHRLEHACRGIEHRNGVPRRRVGKLQLCRFHCRAVDLLDCTAAAAFAKVQKAPGTAARQRQRRCQHKRRPSFFMHHFRPRSILYSNLHGTPCTEDSEDSISYSAAECESKCVKICCTISVRKSILTSRQKNATLYAGQAGGTQTARFMTRYRRQYLCLTKSRTLIPKKISPT